MQEFLLELGTKNGLAFPELSLEKLVFHSYKEQIDILIAQQIPIVSFTFGIPNDESLLANGTILIGTATCLEEALLLDQKGIAIITAQGIAAGGHRGTFLDSIPLPEIGVMALVSQITDHIDQPVLASGAINDGKTIRLLSPLPKAWRFRLINRRFWRQKIPIANLPVHFPDDGLVVCKINL